MTVRYVSYIRVSTEKQGVSGLGLEAQREAIRRHLGGAELLAEYQETESGKRSDRPKLKAALGHCKKAKAKLIIAKLDRLTRNLHFVTGLMESGVDFVAADNPHATRLTIHILVAVAENERQMIGERTRAALAAKKARGFTLGNPRWQESIGKALAASKPAPIPPRIVKMIAVMRAEGCSLRTIAGELNGLNIATPRQKPWHAQSVARVLVGGAEIKGVSDGSKGRQARGRGAEAEQSQSITEERGHGPAFGSGREESMAAPTQIEGRARGAAGISGME